MQDSGVYAIILVKNRNSGSLDEQRAYNGNEIYLNDGDEFQIRLFNPTSSRVGAKISINGESSEHLLVLNPGQDFIVDRFVDTRRKMVFETYTYDESNPKARAAVENNGMVQVDFFLERKLYYDYNPYSSTGTLYGTTVDTSGGGNAPTTTTTSGNGMRFFSADFDSLQGKKGKARKERRRETGRVNRGNKSQQEFTEVDVDFESLPFHTVTYHLKPVSARKVITTEQYDIREYCTECGYRIRNKKWKYCPKCGNRL